MTPQPIDSTYIAPPRITELGEAFHDVVAPARFPSFLLRFRNLRWDERIDLGSLTDAEWKAHFARFEALPDISKGRSGLANALRPLDAGTALTPAPADVESAMVQGTCRKVLFRLGLAPNGDTDAALLDAVYAFLQDSGVSYDRFFFDLHGGMARLPRALSGAAGAHYAGTRWNALRAIVELSQPGRDAVPQYFDGEGACSLLIDEIEAIWAAIADRDDWTPFYAKIERIRAMGAALGACTGGNP